MSKKRTKAELQSQLEKQEILLLNALQRAQSLDAFIRASAELDVEKESLAKLSKEVATLLGNALEG